MATHWVKGGPHPDMDDAGNLQVDYLLTPASAAQRDFDRDYRRDYDQAVADIKRRQSELPEFVQTWVGGRTFEGRTPSEGLANYRRELEWAKRNYAEQLGYRRLITDEELSRMSLSQTDEVLDDKGVPREGILLWHTRAQRLTDGMDGFSRAELQNVRRKP
jgi:hypothetical protein